MSVNNNQAASQRNMKKLSISKMFSFLAGVVVTANFRKTSKMPELDTQGPGRNHDMK